MMRNKLAIVLAFGALGLIGAGLSWIYPPAGLVGVGLLIWLDLSLQGGGKKR